VLFFHILTGLKDEVVKLAALCGTITVKYLQKQSIQVNATDVKLQTA